MKKILDGPVARLFARALLSGVAVFGAELERGGSLDGSALKAAGVAAVWAVLEYATPLNKLVGPRA